MKKIAWVAVIVGGIVDMILTNLFAVPLIIAIFARNPNVAHLPAEQITASYLAILHANFALYATAVFTGCLASFVAGLIAAFIAKHDRVLNGALSAWACAGLDVWGIATHTSTDGLALQIILMPVAPALGALAGWIVACRRAKGDADRRRLVRDNRQVPIVS